ncbi:MAG: hypothetical protein ACJ72Z_12650, partial [Pyrinomonadaceae bacterium]
MKTAFPRAAKLVKGKRFNARTFPVLFNLVLIFVMSATGYSNGTSSAQSGILDLARMNAPDSKAWWQALEYGKQPEALTPPTSSLIVQIGFNPFNQPENFTAGESNPETQPLLIQTQRADGVGENMTGDGETVFIEMSTSSSTGRFDMTPTGAFSASTLTLTIRSGRQNSQSFFYRDDTPGAVVLTATVTAVANTGLSFGETTSVTKSVIAVGENKLSFGTQPGSARKDASIMPPVRVRVEDSAGNLITSSNRDVSLAIGSNPGGGTLSGTTTVAAVGGIATFNNLSIDKAGNGYTLVASSESPSPALIVATSNPFNINKLDQTIEFDELEDKTYGDDDFDVNATASSGLQITFTSQTLDACLVEENHVRIVAAGLCTVRASQAGDSNTNFASSVDRTFLVNKADATVVVSPYDVVYDGQSHASTVTTITGVKGETSAEVGNVDVSETIHTNASEYPKDQWTFMGTGNYNDTSGMVKNNISKAFATATAGSGSATYDGNAKTPSSCVISGPGYLGDLSCSNEPANVGPGANSYTIAASLSGKSLSNFDVALADGTYTIHKAPTVLTISFEDGPYVYRGSAFMATARVTGAGGLDQANLPVNYIGDCLNVTTANGCRATAAYSESANHLESVGNAGITIAKKALTV